MKQEDVPFHRNGESCHHAKMSLNRLIERLEKPEPDIDEKTAKEISDLVDSRPNLLPPTARYSKPNNGCIR